MLTTVKHKCYAKITMQYILKISRFCNEKGMQIWVTPNRYSPSKQTKRTESFVSCSSKQSLNRFSMFEQTTLQLLTFVNTLRCFYGLNFCYDSRRKRWWFCSVLRRLFIVFDEGSGLFFILRCPMQSQYKIPAAGDFLADCGARYLPHRSVHPSPACDCCSH